MRTITGDLISLAKAGQFDVIAHGCNCMHVMGGGLAAQIRRHFPEAYAADLATPRGNPAKLGTCSMATVTTAAGNLDVVNAYTQLDFGAGRVQVDYAAVRSCMAWISSAYRGRRIGLPQLGAGLGGGDWRRIEAIIRDELGQEDLLIVQFAGAP